MNVLRNAEIKPFHSTDQIVLFEIRLYFGSVACLK